MNDNIFEHVRKYNAANGWEQNEEGVIETIREAQRIQEEVIKKHRWYEDIFVVVVVDTMPIGFNDFNATGDTSFKDMDLHFDPTTICEVEEYTVIRYRRKE